MNIGVSTSSKVYEVILAQDNSENIEVIFTGDFCPGKRTENLCKNKKYDSIFNNTLPILRDKDFGIVNLECPITEAWNPIVKVGPHLQSKPIVIDALRYAGFNIALLANNHILDHGVVGLQDTLENCRSFGIKTVGAGLNRAEAEQPLIVSKGNISLGFINCTENEFSVSKGNRAGAFGLDPISIYYKVNELKNKVDNIILIIHGGNEHYPLPNPQMVKLYHFFADIGVTAIIGHHAHCTSGFEVYKGVPIFYSLGNFLFDVEEKQDELWYLGYIVKLSISKKSITKISIYPFEQFRSGDGVLLLEGNEYKKFINNINELSRIICNMNLLNEHWDKFCRDKEKYYMSTLFNLGRLKRALVRRGIGVNYFVSKKAILELLDKVQCEAHREALIRILESNIN